MLVFLFILIAVALILGGLALDTFLLKRAALRRREGFTR